MFYGMTFIEGKKKRLPKKVCKECLENKPVTCFASAPSNKDGLQNKCKTCKNRLRKPKGRTFTQVKLSQQIKNNEYA